MKQARWFLLATGGVILAAIWVRARPSWLPDERTWRTSLAAGLGAESATRVIGSAKSHLAELLAQRKRYPHPALNTHMSQRILPGLALYRALQIEVGDSQLALVMTGQALDAAVRAAYAPIKRIAAQPWFFPLFRRVLRLQMTLSFPSPGWKTNWLQDDEHAVAFSISECFYQRVLLEYGAPELTPAFCHTDEAGMQGVHGMVFKRRGTIGGGAPLCDFCYRKIA